MAMMKSLLGMLVTGQSAMVMMKSLLGGDAGQQAGVERC